MLEPNDYEKLNTNSAMVHTIAGAFAGLTEHCVMYPFDSVKTRLQSLCPCPETKCPSVIHGLASIMKREGWWRPLRGVTAVAWGSVPAHAAYFATYEKSKKLFLSSNKVCNTAAYGFSGVLATIVHDAFMNPFEVVKQRMQTMYSPYGNSLECIRCIYRIEGFKAFYRSYAVQLLMNVPFHTVHFVTYDSLQQFFNPNHHYNPISHMISGGIAGGLAAALTTPLDCIKTVLNTQQSPEILCDHRLLLKNTPETCGGIMNSIKLIGKMRGTTGFFRGLQARVVFQIPSTALSWSIYELFKYLLLLNGVEHNNLIVQN